MHFDLRVFAVSCAMEGFLMPRRLLGIFLSIVLCSSSRLAAQKTDPPATDPRLGVLNLKYEKEKEKELVEFDLVNQAPAPIVFWVAVLRCAVISTRRSLPKDIGVGRRVEIWDKKEYDAIEPGGRRHVVVSRSPADAATRVARGASELYGVTALFADGSWAGEWAFVERQVKAMTILRLAAQQWLVSLRALPADPDPVATVAGLLRRLERLPRPGGGWSGLPAPGPQSLAEHPAAGRRAPPEEMARQNIDHFAAFNLRFFAQRCYDKMLMLDRRGADPKRWRDERAEKRLKSRADAKEQLANRIAEETAMLELELEVTAWVTMFGPNGERIGPAVPPPAPTAAAMARWKQSMATRRLPPDGSAVPPALKARPAP